MKTFEESEYHAISLREPLDFDKERISFQLRLFDSCIPRDFQNIEDRDVQHNRAVWEKIVVKYCERLPEVLQNGASIFFSGDNGTGKTMFACYILMCALKDDYTAYYTTTLDLDYHLRRGFGDSSYIDRLECMLESDFLVIDELGSETTKLDKDSFMRAQLERVLKRRYENSMPTILASNATIKQLSSTYGTSVRSLLTGKKYIAAVFESGDYRMRLKSDIFEKLGIRK